MRDFRRVLLPNLGWAPDSVGAWYSYTVSNQIDAWAGPVLSEYSYGTSLTMEIVAELGGASSLVAAPLVPSLQKEADLGFDVAIQAQWVLVCLQFKVSKKLVRSNAGQAAELGVPYWRFSAKTGATSNGTSQHNTLCHLQDSLAGANQGFVYYAAPTFDQYDEFSRLTMAESLVARSAFPTPLLLGHVPLGEPHCYAYKDPDQVRAYSTPGPETRTSFGVVLDEIQSGPTGPQRGPEEFLREVVPVLQNISRLEVEPDLPPHVQVAQHSLGLGVQALLVGRNPVPDVPSSGQESDRSQVPPNRTLIDTAGLSE